MANHDLPVMTDKIAELVVSAVVDEGAANGSLFAELVNTMPKEDAVSMVKEFADTGEMPRITRREAMRTMLTRGGQLVLALAATVTGLRAGDHIANGLQHRRDAERESDPNNKAYALQQSEAAFKLATTNLLQTGVLLVAMKKALPEAMESDHHKSFISAVEAFAREFDQALRKINPELAPAR